MTIFWIVGFTNIVNLIDGLDGLAAGISFIACIAVCAMTLQLGQTDLACISLALAGATVGFLRYNFNPAKIFMGDTGSMLLGYTLAAISVMGAVKTAAMIALVVPAIVLGLPILDTLFAIVRRKISGRPIFKPDKGHVHHRLLAQGLTQKQAVLLMYAVTALFGGVSVIVAEVNAWVGATLVLVIFLCSIYIARRLGVISIVMRQGIRYHVLQLNAATRMIPYPLIAMNWLKPWRILMILIRNNHLWGAWRPIFSILLRWRQLC